MPESDLKKYLVDILSLLALTMYAEGERESLKYRLLGSEGDIGSWGHEYVRNLAGEIAQEFQKRQHNAESEAVELLMEVEDLDLLVRLDCKQLAICWHIQPQTANNLSRFEVYHLGRISLHALHPCPGYAAKDGDDCG